MTTRLDVLKTYKLFIDGKFPRSESGRSTPVVDAKGRVLAHACRASRKDLRDAVEAARRSQGPWASSTAYLRGQILYRMAEMIEGKRAELAEAIASPAVSPGAKAKGRGKGGRGVLSPAVEVSTAVDRLVHYAGWSDKYSQVLGCHNAVAGAYYNFTFAEPTGVVAVVAPDEAPLLALVSLFAPVICAGNSVVAIASQANPLPAAVLGEALATSDLPGGVVNLLTGERGELLPHTASHRDIDAIHSANLSDDENRLLRSGTAENVKRVTTRSGVDWTDTQACHTPWWIEPFVEMKTVWHPASS